MGIPLLKNVNVLTWEKRLGWVSLVVYLLFTAFCMFFNGLYDGYPETDWSECCPAWEINGGMMDDGFNSWLLITYIPRSLINFKFYILYKIKSSMLISIGFCIIRSLIWKFYYSGIKLNNKNFRMHGHTFFIITCI